MFALQRVYIQILLAIALAATLVLVLRGPSLLVLNHLMVRLTNIIGILNGFINLKSLWEFFTLVRKMHNNSNTVIFGSPDRVNYAIHRTQLTRK